MDVYQIVNQRILDLMSKGCISWKKPWNAATNTPRNISSGKEYKGLNVFLLNAMNYSNPYFASYRQVVERGGHVKKGEKGNIVVFYKLMDKKQPEDTDTEPTKSGKWPFLRYYTVFNCLEQCEGLEVPSPQEAINEFTPIENAERIVRNMPLRPDIQYGGNRALYSPGLDFVRMPHEHTFNSPAEFYSTLFHELAHSTGHASRLGRKAILEPSYFGSHEYSREECCVEFASSFLAAVAGIETQTIENSAAYISNWMKVLKDDKKLLVIAASQGQKAADWILGRHQTEEEPV